MNTEIIAVVGLAFIIPTALCVLLFLKMSKLKNRLDTVTSGIEDANLERIVKKYTETLESCANDIERMNTEFEKIRTDTADFFRKVGLVRYQGFKDTGGDQSFSLALLNQKDSGLIITGLFGRDFSKMYAKKVENGTSSHSLTDEEQQALNEAMQS